MNNFGKVTPHRQPLVISPAGPASASACDVCEARHVGMCEVLSDEDLAFLTSAALCVTLPAGKLLMEEGEPATYFYNVNAGTVRLFKSLPDGRRQITGFASSGHFIGLASNDLNMVSAEAITSVQACRFSRTALTSILADYPALERRLLDIAMHELVLNQQQLLLLGRKTATEKIATFLLSWWRRQEGCTDALPAANFKLSLPISRTDLADYLGLTIETVSRSLSSLKKEGLIEIPSIHEILFLRPQALANLAEAVD